MIRTVPATALILTLIALPVTTAIDAKATPKAESKTAEFFKLADLNKDGKINLSEFMKSYKDAIKKQHPDVDPDNYNASIESQFNVFDLNRDGIILPYEMDVYFSKAGGKK